MNEQDFNQLREQIWRRPLTPEEIAQIQRQLAAHPSARANWDDEIALSQVLERLPAAPPVSSNFTARVLQTAALENAARNRAPASGLSFWKNIRNWLPKAAVAGLALSLTVVGYHEHQVNVRTALAKNVVEFSAAVSASDPTAMEDFEPIRQLSDAQPKADIELLALMK